ncbi:MAG: hypothetical protein JST42_11445 [Bacteroidetes bacterium]|nr:hypothetical protein [Bacteroidota bacterium]
MLNQKDNDFDDLFRRASDRYPLRTDSADWDRMAAALDNPSSTELTDEGLREDKRRRRRFLWLFLLLPLGGAGYYFLHGAGSHSGISGDGSAAERTVAPGKGRNSGVDARGGMSGDDGSAGTRGDDGSEGMGNVDGAGGTGGVDGAAGTRRVDAAAGTRSVNASRGTAGVDGAGGTSGVAGKDAVARGAAGVDAGGRTAGVSSGKIGRNDVGRSVRPSADGRDGLSLNGNRVHSGGRGDVAGGRGVRRGNIVSGRSMAGDGKMSDPDDVVVNGKRKRNARPAGNGTDDMGDNNFDAVSNITGGAGNAGGGAGVPAGRVAGYPVNRVGMRGDYRLSVNVEAPVVAKDSSKAKPKASQRKKNSFVYAGLMAAPDFSTVKFQHVDGVGTTFSLLLGYQFNKKWAVETGVSVDRKKYYTSAEYFDKKGLSSIRPNWEPTNMDGTCYMWEIPINVRYNFSQTDKTSWFATGGLSTYFMTSENYNYQYNYYTPWGSGSGTSNLDVKKPSNYWFSIINLSAGYEHRIGNIGNLRIEPYLRIPMSGLGTGKLNILSSGINIGITRRLW